MSSSFSRNPLSIAQQNIVPGTIDTANQHVTIASRRCLRLPLNLPGAGAQLTAGHPLRAVTGRYCPFFYGLGVLTNPLTAVILFCEVVGTVGTVTPISSLPPPWERETPFCA